MKRAVLSGSQIISKALYDAGVRFFSGYPITPASGIYFEMLRLLENDGVGIGAPDEITAISFVIGASMAGLKSATATSGPGFSLMIESISYALITETPIVVVLAQRLGPATGSATTSSQGDLLFSIFSNSGSYPIPVLSPVSHRDAYKITVEAVNISEMLRTPVILLVDKDLTMAYETVSEEDLKYEGKIVERKGFTYGTFKTYGFDYPYEIPPFLEVGNPQFKLRITGSTHDKDGFLRKDEPEALEVLSHLREKILKTRDKIFICDEIGEGRDFLLISYGVTARAVLDAYEILENKDLFKILIFKTLYPLPSDEKLLKLLNGFKKIFVVEQNPMGELAFLLKAHLKTHIPIESITSYVLIPPQYIKERLSWLS